MYTVEYHEGVIPPELNVGRYWFVIKEDIYGKHIVSVCTVKFTAMMFADSLNKEDYRKNWS